MSKVLNNIGNGITYMNIAMEKRELLEFYREQYVLELDRKNELTSVVQVRLVALLSMASILTYMLKTFELSFEANPILVVFMLASGISIVVFLYLAWSLYKAYWGTTYLRLPSIKELERARRQFDESGLLSERPDVYIDYLIRELSNCMEANIQSNDLRNNTMNKIMKKLPWATIPFAIAGSIYLVGDLDASSARKPIAIEIIDKPNDQ
ncbi:conserved membrane hypothetical protein [Vibrio chagasii]|nr:conserved membrane hypothetical protein [Vibrio chagasii]CAH6944536.1 conserved membrane hypothetical protein [Vibrio chagasii]CAH6944736.1 conserved membrane hypothetical protein [Vibrio chagasii]CAH7107438.1 conserved membrane hypothetical protein [Vibrio chagasii]